MSEQTILDWVECGRCGNQEAIYNLWTLYRPLCETWAKKTRLTYWDKEDLVQQSYLILLEALDKYKRQEGMPFGGYYKMRLYIWRSRQFRKKQEQSSNFESVERAMEQVASLKDDLEVAVEDHLMAELILEKFQCLSPKESQLLWAYLVEGHPISSLCETFGLTLEGLKTRRKRGLKKLKEKILLWE